MRNYLLSISLLFISGSLGALEGVITFEALEAKVKAVEEKLEKISSASEENGDIIALECASPEVEGRKWYVLFDLLYAKANVNGTGFAYTNSQPAIALPLKGRMRQVELGWNLGFRVGLGKNFEHDGWNGEFLYSFFESHGSRTTHGGYNSVIIPTKGSIVTDESALKAKSQLDFEIQMLDVQLGRHFYVSGHCSLRPFFGLKSGWIDIDQETRYTGGTFLGVRTAHVYDSSHFWGLGPKLGLATEWDLRDGFYLSAAFSGALLYGNFDVDLKERLTSTGDSVKLEDDEQQFSPTIDLFLGVGYGRYIRERTMHLSFTVGYELEYWWRQNQSLRVYEYSAYRYEKVSEDLGLRGLSIKARWDF